MKNLVRYLPHPGIIAVLAALLMVVEHYVSPYVISWVAFQAWAMYFLAGAKPGPGIKAFFCYLGGIGASFLIVALIGRLAPVLGAPLAPALVVAVVAFGVICFEKFPPLDFIPGWFLGSGAYFAMINGACTGLTVDGQKLTAISNTQALMFMSTTCAFGIVLGWLTVLLRTKYAEMTTPPAAVAPPTAAPLRERVAEKV